MKRRAWFAAPLVFVTFLFASGASAGSNADLGSGLQPVQQTGSEASAATSRAVRAALGVPEPSGMSAVEQSLAIAAGVRAGGLDPSGPAPRSVALSSGGVPNFMHPGAPLSAAVATTVGGTGVILLGDWDGKEDLTADIQGHVDDVATRVPGPGAPDFTLTRVAVSAHSIANGFNENVFYYGDNFGNVYVAASTNLQSLGALPAANVVVLNLPTMLNAFGTLNSDSHIVVTGLAVSPVADLSSYTNVNGGYAPYNGLTGEIVYVAFWDAGGGVRLATGNRPIHSGILAFPVADLTSVAAAPPGIQSTLGFPVTVGGTFGVVFSVYANIAGVAVDDDGNSYFQQVDLLGLTGGNIVKITDTGDDRDRSPATSGWQTLTTLNPTAGVYGTSSGPLTQVNRFTNYSGTAKLFGDIVALAAGPGNVLYAAVSSSASGFFGTQAQIGPTPSMVISFADATGAFDSCSSPGPGLPGIIKIADGRADRQYGTALVPGVNNFRAFALGAGPDRRIATSALLKAVFGTAASTLKLDFVVDYSIYSGLTVDELGAVYVVSGGTPYGVGLNQSPTRGEILLFPDQDPADRRADRIDLRKNTIPNPPDAGANVGDGDSDRFDHLFWMAPPDPMTFRPAAVSGLARGFLRYLNRTAPNAIAGLPNGDVLHDDSFAGPINFNDFDASGEVAGGYDFTYPLTGDDSNGGFEFNFGGFCSAPWLSFYLSSNGFVSFGAGSTENSPTAAALQTGPPRIGTWADFNADTRSSAKNTFPVQAVGFAGINTFAVRFIDVPLFAGQGCGNSNTFSIMLWDDGTGLDESSPTSAEGPTARRFRKVGTRNVGANPRPDKSGYVYLRYGRMDALGTTIQPVIAGYSIGSQPLPAPPETNLSKVLPTAFVGTGAQPVIHEDFNTGTAGPPAVPSLDLRFEGNNGATAKPAGQTDANRDFLRFKGRSCQ